MAWWVGPCIVAMSPSRAAWVQICMPYRIVGWPSEQSVENERNFAHRVAQ